MYTKINLSLSHTSDGYIRKSTPYGLIMIRVETDLKGFVQCITAFCDNWIPGNGYHSFITMIILHI